MQIWLSFNNFEEKLQLPVVPKDFKVSTSNKNTALPIINLGNLNIIGDSELIEISPIESFFPTEYSPFCAYRNIPKPMDAVELINKWKASKRPIRLIVSELKVNMPVAIERFEYGFTAGSEDIEYNLQLKEYKFIEVTKVSDSTTEETIRPTDKEVPKTYTVKSGDTLSSIAKRLTGKSDNWRAIYNTNKSLIGNDPNKIIAGQKLVISI